MRGAQGRLHHAAGRAENGPRAGISAQQRIHLLVIRQIAEINARALNHAAQLARRQRNINVLLPGAAHFLAPLNLKFLGGARHDGHHENVLRVQPLLLRIIRLRQRADHGMRRLGRGEIVNEIRREFFHVVGPRRTATGNQRQRPAPVRETLNELGAFLNDGQVRAEVGVEHRGKAQPPQRGIDFAGQQRARLIAEIFAQRHAHGGRNLRHAMLGGVRQSGIHFRSVAVLINRANRTMRRTLAALDARRFSQRNIRRRRNSHLLAAPDELQRPNALHALADSGAAPAQNALFGMQLQRAGRVIRRQIAQTLAIRSFANAELSRQPLQFAVVVARTLKAVVRMRRKNQLNDGAPDAIQLRVVRGDFKPLRRRSRARAHQPVQPLDLHDANAAGRPRRQVRVVAKTRNFNLGLLSRVQNVGAGLDFHRVAVNR